MNKADQLLLDEVFRKIIAVQLAKTLDSCPGDCGNEERLEAYRWQLLELKPEELAGKVEEVCSQNQWLQEQLTRKQLKDRLSKGY